MKLADSWNEIKFISRKGVRYHGHGERDGSQGGQEDSGVAELESATRSNLKLRHSHTEIVCNK